MFPGIWAVINTAGSSGRGGASCWESALKGNVLGALRVARTFSPLLAAAAADHPHAGRLFYIGMFLTLLWQTKSTRSNHTTNHMEVVLKSQDKAKFDAGQKVKDEN